MIDKEFYRNKEKYTYEDLLRITADLRAPDGCPWDRAQTHESLNTCMIEECYETVNAVRHNDMENLREELGDVLLGVILNSQIAKEEGAFTIEDVIQELCEKLIRRHPHVFGEAKAGTPEEGRRRWDEIKKSEKKSAAEEKKNELERVPESLPALIRIQKIQKKAEKAGLTKPDAQASAARIREKLEAVEADFSEKNREKLTEHAGEMLLESAELLRIVGINAENSLTIATEQYITILADSINIGK